MRRARLLLPLFLWSALAMGQPIASRPLTAAEAQALVGRALATELNAAQDTSHPMRYRLRKQSPRLTSTKEIIETREGFVARLVAINDQPLSQSDDEKEQARLDALLSDPSRQQHRKQSEDQDAGIVLKLLRMLPQAFLYQYAGTSAGVSGTGERFTFKPNPGFNPPDFETEALTSMTGEILIDAAGERVARLEGHLNQDTDYGWGILGKLNRGGWIVLEQASVGGGQWRIVHLKLQMTLRILFKSKNIDTIEEMSQYVPVPAGIDYRQAIRLLRSGDGNAAHSGSR